MRLTLILSFHLLLFIYTVHPADRKYVCLYPSDNTNLCASMEVGTSKISCVSVVDSVDCALKIANGTADFGVFKPEEAVLVAKYGFTDQQFAQNISVIGEIRYTSNADDVYSFQQVVVVPVNFTGNYRNKKYCHPGFQSNNALTDRVLKHFERKVVDMSCKSSVNAAEQEIAQLSDYFSAACRPGPWAKSPHLDKMLKRAYPNLCELCSSASTCSYSDDGFGNTNRQVLDCLAFRGGDIAYARYGDVVKYFGLRPGGQQMADPAQYKLACPDGTFRSLTESVPCPWVNQPWSLLLSKRDGSEGLQSEMIHWLSRHERVSDSDWRWQQALRTLVLHETGRKVFINSTGPTPVGDYLKRGCDDDPDGATCREAVKWCTLGYEELKKCKWTKAAAASHGMVPKILCVSSQSLWNCLTNVATGKADVVGIDTEYGLPARKVFNMSTVVYEDNDHTSNYHIIAVKKKANTDIKSFADLAYRKACFPQYRGLGWMAFVKTANDLSLMKQSCPERFFSAACAPGAIDNHYTLGTVSSNVCDLCPASNDAPCAADPSNPFFGDLGAISCLMKDVGDVAFVDYNRIVSRDGTLLDTNIDPNTLQVICRNGSVSLIPGLDVEEDCALSLGIRGEILTRANNSVVAGRDTSELFLKMNEWFGTVLFSYKGVFKMFNTFEGQNDLLFKDGTVSLVQSTDTEYPMINSYVSLLSSDLSCSRSDIVKASFITFIISVYFLLRLAN